MSDYRDDYPLSDAIRDAHSEDTEERDYAAARADRLEAVLSVCRRIVNAQAEDEGLWALNLDGTLPASEAYLQQELRSLHAAVEGDLNAIAAIEDS